MKTIELKVTGMKCVHCEQHVADAIESVAGVEKAVADHNHDRVLVRLSDDNVSLDDMKKAVNDAAGDHSWNVEGIVE